MSQQTLLQVSNLSKNFGGVRAVAGVSFTVNQGEPLGIIGPNGSGKSTLINLITGFVRPSGGQVVYRGQDITGRPPHAIVSLGIARSFQMARPFANLPAYRNLVVPLYSPRVRRQRGGRYGDRDEVAVHLLEDVGFERDSPVPYKPAGALPHGYLKRLELARCLALDPDIIILDELFSGMSMSEVAGILPLLERLVATGKTLIMVEHRLSELFRVVKRVIVLNFGAKIAEGSPDAVMAQETVRSAYLGSEVEDGA